MGRRISPAPRPASLSEREKGKLEEEVTFTLEDLPNEILTEILSYSDSETIAAFWETSRRHCEIVENSPTLKRSAYRVISGKHKLPETLDNETVIEWLALEKKKNEITAKEREIHKPINRVESTKTSLRRSTVCCYLLGVSFFIAGAVVHSKEAKIADVLLGLGGATCFLGCVVSAVEGTYTSYKKDGLKYLRSGPLWRLNDRFHCLKTKQSLLISNALRYGRRTDSDDDPKAAQETRRYGTFN